MPCQLRDHRHDPLELDPRRYRPCIGPGRLPAHVHNVRAGVEERQAVSDGLLGEDKPPAIREGVRGDVENTHHPRAPPPPDLRETLFQHATTVQDGPASFQGLPTNGPDPGR